MMSTHKCTLIFLCAVVGAIITPLALSAAASPKVSPSAALVAQNQLDEEQARFLLTRTGFAPNRAELLPYIGLSRRAAVEQLLAANSDEMDALATRSAPPWTTESLAARKRNQDMNDAERKERRALEQQQIFALRGWWLSQMLSSPSPLTERMTLFWHNHFVSSHQKVQVATLMYRQNQLFRKQALGNFATLLHAASKDPAMLLYLDNAASRKGAPNENFAREVMELFALGEGHYTEQDIKEAARAFTGWSIERESGEFKWRAQLHDDQSKTVLGGQGAFDGDAVLDLILAQPACAEFIVDKLWREFVSPAPEAAEVHRIAARFREANYDMRTALRELFLTPAFWAPESRAQLVKSPVELLVGTMKQFDFHYSDPLPFTFAVAQLGQNLFNPPNVKGWPGGDAWINSSSLLARKSVLERVFRTVETGQLVKADKLDASSNANNGDGGMGEMRAPTMLKASTAQLGAVKGQGALGREGKLRFADAAANIGFDADGWLARFGIAQDEVPDVRQRLAIQKEVLAMEPAVPIRADLRGAAYLRTLLMDPVFQLK